MLYSAYSNSEVNGFNSDDGVPLDGGSPSAAFVNAGKKSSQKSNTKAELIRMLLEMSPSEVRCCSKFGIHYHDEELLLLFLVGSF